MKIFFKTLLIILTFQTFAIAICDVKAKFGEKKEVLEQKEFIGRPFPLEYVGLEVYPILANDICPNEKLDDIAIEYRFLYDELVAINFVAINDDRNIPTEKLTLMNAQLLTCEKEVDRLNEYVQIMELQGDGKEKR